MIPKPPISPTSTSSQVLKSGLRFGVVIGVVIVAVLARVVRLVLDLALVLGFDLVFVLDLHGWVARAIGKAYDSQSLTLTMGIR